MQTFGVNSGQYASVMYLNGAAMGETPATGADDWRETAVTLPAQALPGGRPPAEDRAALRPGALSLPQRNPVVAALGIRPAPR